jgi:uncharacterized protein with NRDE domain
MCLILFAYNIHSRYPLVIGANRDEFFSRPTAPVSFWHDRPDILAGRDLKNQGTWLGITRSGRLAALTNFRAPGSLKGNAPSRGLIVSDFLGGSMPAPGYLEDIRKTGGVHNGFNLIVGDRSGIYHYSNRADHIHRLSPGLYGLSNHLLDTPWPKVTKGKKELGSIVRQNRTIPAEAVMALLADGQRFADETLPDTGIGLAWERRLSSIFIAGREYGTRSSAVLLLENSGRARFTEATFQNSPPPETAPATRTVCFTTRLFPG